MYTIDLVNDMFIIKEIDNYQPKQFVYSCLLDIADLENIDVPREIMTESWLAVYLQEKGVEIDLGEW